MNNGNNREHDLDDEANTLETHLVNTSSNRDVDLYVIKSSTVTRVERSVGAGIKRAEIASWGADEYIKIKPLKSRNQPAYEKIREIWISRECIAPWDPENAIDKGVGNNRDGEQYFYLKGLPPGLGCVFNFGMTSPAQYSRIITAIENSGNFTTLIIGQRESSPHVSGSFSVSLAAWLECVKEIDTTLDRSARIAKRINDQHAKNLVRTAQGLDFEPLRPGRTPLTQQMSDLVSGDSSLDSIDVENILKLMSAESSYLAAKKPLHMIKLAEKIDLVNLRVLIESFKNELSTNTSDEKKWQQFFHLNPFALQQVFSSPVVLQQKEALVRFPGLNASGSHITDFLLVNPVTTNAHLVEIKTPRTRLMGNKEYRGDVYAAHRDFIGSIAQLQAQIEESAETIRRSISQEVESLLISSHRKLDAENFQMISTITVSGALIIGSLSDLNSGQLKSFMRLRASLPGISLVTYDEVLHRLEGLCKLLAPEPDASSRTGV